MKILVYPMGADMYQKLLYSELNKYDSVTLFYFRLSFLSFLFTPILFLWYRLRGARILHIHWVSFATKKFGPLSPLFSTINSYVCLAFAKLLGFRIIWTVHNIVPHEQLTLDDKAISRFLSRIASATIAHSRETISQMESIGLSTKNVHIIPIGSYIGSYPDTISRDDARKRLGIADDEFVVLFLGIIRAYKGVPDLLDAMSHATQPRVRLVIAGACDDPALRRQITDYQTKHAALFHDGFVDDEELQIYFRAADVTCLPFKTITTSGSALLALSFATPVIAPKIGALKEFPQNVGWLYDPDESDALLNALTQAIAQKNHLDSYQKNAYTYASSLSWDKIAVQTKELYETVA